jgi:hypothetical protein
MRVQGWSACCALARSDLSLSDVEVPLRQVLLHSHLLEVCQQGKDLLLLFQHAEDTWKVARQDVRIKTQSVRLRTKSSVCSSVCML